MLNGANQFTLVSITFFLMETDVNWLPSVYTSFHHKTIFVDEGFFFGLNRWKLVESSFHQFPPVPTSSHQFQSVVQTGVNQCNPVYTSFHHFPVILTGKNPLKSGLHQFTPMQTDLNRFKPGSTKLHQFTPNYFSLHWFASSHTSLHHFPSSFEKQI
jgi:hypothetical protein